MNEAILIRVPADLMTVQRGVAVVQKDVADSRDYGWDFTDWLGDDSIQSATVTLSGIESAETDSNGDPLVHIDGDSAGNNMVFVWLKNGINKSTATCTATTAGNRVTKRTILFLLKTR